MRKSEGVRQGRHEAVAACCAPSAVRHAERCAQIYASRVLAGRVARQGRPMTVCHEAHHAELRSPAAMLTKTTWSVGLAAFQPSARLLRRADRRHSHSSFTKSSGPTRTCFITPLTDAFWRTRSRDNLKISKLSFSQHLSSQVKIYKKGNVCQVSSYAFAQQNPGCERVI